MIEKVVYEYELGKYGMGGRIDEDNGDVDGGLNEDGDHKSDDVGARYPDYVLFPSDRGSGFHFGPGITRAFCEENGVELIIRSHQLKRSGWEYQRNGNEQLLTVFSAPNYCGNVGNQGAWCTLTFASHRQIHVDIKVFESVNT
jgi:hypothetical protein